MFLLFTALVFDFLFLIGKVKDPSIAHWFVIVAAALAIPTVITGLYAAEQEHAGHSNILLHRNWALVTLAYSLGLFGNEANWIIKGEIDWEQETGLPDLCQMEKAAIENRLDIESIRRETTAIAKKG